MHCFFSSGECLDCSFCLVHVTALELYHNFSFAAQLYSIFMLLSDAALSAHEWYFRTVSTIRSNLRQIKLLLFLLGGGRGSLSRAFFLWTIKTVVSGAFFIKGDYTWGHAYFRIKDFVLKCFSLLAKLSSGHLCSVIRKSDILKRCS